MDSFVVMALIATLGTWFVTFDRWICQTRSTRTEKKSTHRNIHGNRDLIEKEVPPFDLYRKAE